MEHCTVRPQRRKLEQGDTEAPQAPVAKYAHEVSSGYRSVMIGFYFSHETIQWYYREMTFVFMVCEIQYEADAEFWLVFGKERRH